MKVLFCSPSNLGFLFPAMGLAIALRRRGHEVAFVTDITRGEILRQHGLARIPRGRKDGHSFQIESWFYPLPIAMQVKHIEYALEQFEADVLVGQPLAMGAYLVGERRALPVAVLGLASPLWPTDRTLATRAPRGEREERLLWRHQDMMRYYNEARKMFRLPPSRASFLDSPLLGDLFLAPSLPELWGDQESLPERIRLIGSCLWEPPAEDPEVREWLAKAREEGRRVAYLSFGRNFSGVDPLERIAPFLRDGSFRVIASLGRSDHQLEEVPEHVLVRDFLPQGQVLPQADLVVCGGNSTVTLGALSEGVPSLLLYGAGEQADVARMCEKTGAGMALPVNETTPDEILHAIKDLTVHEKYRQRARSLSRAFARYNGPELAADSLERLSAARSSRTRAAARLAVAS